MSAHFDTHIAAAAALGIPAALRSSADENPVMGQSSFFLKELSLSLSLSLSLFAGRGAPDAETGARALPDHLLHTTPDRGHVCPLSVYEEEDTCLLHTTPDRPHNLEAEPPFAFRV
jgi:hypothetical protein